MRVGILTSWRVPCGVYQYSARLAEAMDKINGVNVVILAGRADDSRSVPEESNLTVYDGAAGIGLWRDDGKYWLDYDGILGLGLDVIHVQYQSMLFNQDALFELASEFNGSKTAITFHDNCQRPDFPYDEFDLHFSHRWNVGPPTVNVVPFGIENRKPIVRTFGLGRTRSDYIKPICDKHGWVFETAASHEPIHGGGQGWRTHKELMDWLRGADAIVLWYDDHGQAGSSQAARTAIATRRPVITNDTKWFEDLPSYIGNYHKVQSLEDLEGALAIELSNSFIETNSWDEVAEMFITKYKEQHVLSQ